VATGGLRALAQPPLPTVLAGTLATRFMWAETIVEAALEGSRETFIQALVLDGAVRSLEEAAALAGGVLPLAFAPEQGVIQTRFISAALLALRLLIGGTAIPDDLPGHVERALSSFDPAPLLGFSQTVFLGRGWRYGLAMAAVLNLQETALVTPAAYQTLDYRHGPIACADAGTLVWSLDAPDDVECAAVLDDVRATDATVHQMGGDPQVALVLAQLLAARIAHARRVDPDAPRNLSRAIVLPLARGPHPH
jgi:fructoselysine-6-P-deglycase FrlB-like protein